MEGDAVGEERDQHIEGDGSLDPAKVHKKGTGGQLDQHRGQGGETLQLGRGILVSGMRNEQFGNNVLQTFAEIRAQRGWKTEN